MLKSSQSQPWDGHGRISSAAMVCAFLINGMVGWPFSLVLLISLIIELNQATGVASAILFITGLGTMGAVSHRERRGNVVILRWISIGLNAVLIAIAATLWFDSRRKGNLPWMLLMGIGILNVICV